MSTVTVEQMEDKLLSIEQVRTKLSSTEPLSTVHISTDSKILFKLDPGWETTLDTTDGTAPVDAIMRINGVDHRLTKDAALQAAGQFGLSSSYVKKTPGVLIEGLLNYHYSGGFGDSEYNVLSVGENIAAFTRPTLIPFSNITLLDSAMEGIQNRYGSDTQVFADYKFNHSLLQTDIRLIVPEETRTITKSHMNDVPGGSEDIWSAGLHLSNSLIGKRQTTLEAYLFRWWCTNGCTTTFADVGTWSRRVDGQQEDVYAWARDSVDDVLGGLEGRFDQIQALTTLNVAGNTADIVREIFSTYDVPVSQRQRITDTLLGSETLTMYSIMNAITEVANDPELDPRRADKLMRIGGDIPTALFDTLKAKVWREGHIAKPTSVNPYEIVSM